MEFTFELLTSHHAVLGLFNHRFVPAVLLANANSCSNTLSCPLGGSPVKSKTFFDHIVHRGTLFLQIGLIVGSVAEHNINIVELKARERVLEAFNYMLA